MVNGNSGSLSIDVSGSTWTCVKSDLDVNYATVDDCYADAPKTEWHWLSWIPGSYTKLVIYGKGGAAYPPIYLNQGWTIAVSPHFVELEVVDSPSDGPWIHAYTNNLKEQWDSSSNTTISHYHNDGGGAHHSFPIDRIVVTDVKLGRMVFDSENLCAPSPGSTCQAFTIGK